MIDRVATAQDGSKSLSCLHNKSDANRYSQHNHGGYSVHQCDVCQEDLPLGLAILALDARGTTSIKESLHCRSPQDHEHVLSIL